MTRQLLLSIYQLFQVELPINSLYFNNFTQMKKIEFQRQPILLRQTLGPFQKIYQAHIENH